jgi:hypothetical protein
MQGAGQGIRKLDLPSAPAPRIHSPSSFGNLHFSICILQFSIAHAAAAARLLY